MSEPLISVIVPVYNGEKYLRECLDSLLAQTYPAVEIIVIDDGSTDGTADICREYSQNNIYYYYKKNAGLAAARNSGIERSNGSYIVFCDADDIYAPDAFRLMAAQLQECDISSVCFLRQENAPSYWPDECRFNTYTALESIKKILYQDPVCHSSSCAKLFKKELFDDVRFVDGLYYEDLEIMPRLYAKCSRIAVSDSKLYFYRRNPSSFINTWHPRRLDTLKATEKVFDFIKSKYPDLIPAARSRRFSAYFNIFVEATRHKNHELAGKCFEVIKRDRMAVLSDPCVRLKNKAGAIASFVGKKILGLIASL